MTYAAFLAKVRVLIGHEANRQGAAEISDELITQGIVALLSSVEAYRKGRQTEYAFNDFTTDRFVSVGQLPVGCEPRSFYQIRNKIAEISAVSDTGDYITTSAAHGIQEATSDDLVDTGFISLGSGAMPGGLVEGKSYFLRPLTTTQFTLHSSAADAVSGENKVDITSAGSGIRVISYSEDRREYELMPWEDRHDMLLGKVCMNNDLPKVCIEPNGSTFYLFPEVVELDANDYTYQVELNWDGISVEWDDSDTVPFVDADALTVADFVRSRMERIVKRDLTMAASYDSTCRDGKRMAFVDAGNRTRTRK